MLPGSAGESRRVGSARLKASRSNRGRSLMLPGSAGESAASVPLG